MYFAGVLLALVCASVSATSLADENIIEGKFTIDIFDAFKYQYGKATPNWYLGFRILFFENKERASEIFIFVHSRNLMERANVFFSLQSKSLEVWATFFSLTKYS